MPVPNHPVRVVLPRMQVRLRPHLQTGGADGPPGRSPHRSRAFPVPRPTSYLTLEPSWGIPPPARPYRGQARVARRPETLLSAGIGRLASLPRWGRTAPNPLSADRALTGTTNTGRCGLRRTRSADDHIIACVMVRQASTLGPYPRNLTARTVKGSTPL